MAPRILSRADLENATGIQDGEKIQVEDDDRSSSLSELGDRAIIEHLSRGGSEANDTEAETERLEDSPQKRRGYQDVVLTPTNGAYGDPPNQSVSHTFPDKMADPGWYPTQKFPLAMADRAAGTRPEGERLGQTSDTSSLVDSDEESGKDLSPVLSISMKRKRSSFEEDSASDRDTLREPSTKAMKLFDSNSAEAPVKLITEVASDVPAVDFDMQINANGAMSPSNKEQPRKRQAQPKQKHKKGKRKSKRTSTDEAATADNAASGAESTVEHGGHSEVVYSNEEDAQVENMAEGVEAENPGKIEERKRVHRRFR